jgi:hypothetical protein
LGEGSVKKACCSQKATFFIEQMHDVHNISIYLHHQFHAATLQPHATFIQSKCKKYTQLCGIKSGIPISNGFDRRSNFRKRYNIQRSQKK